MSSTKNSPLPIGTAVLAVIFCLVMLVTYLLAKPPPPPAELQGIISPNFMPLYDFNLITGLGKPISPADLQGRWSFIFFGYTSCPDVCPATLHELSQVYQRVKDDDQQFAKQMQVIFISVDRKRDTPQKITEYVGYFDKSFIAATGDEMSLTAFSRQFGAGYIIEPETAPGLYNVTHTSAIFLVDPLIRRVATFSQPHYATTIYQQFKKIRAYFSDAT